MRQLFSVPRSCRPAGLHLGVALLFGAAIALAGATGALAQSLPDGAGGTVSCGDVISNGVQATVQSPVNTFPGGDPNDPSTRLPDRDGFDYKTAFVWLRSVGSCASQPNDLWICVETFGHIGDSDGDGSYGTIPGVSCKDPRNIPDGTQAGPVVASNEAYVFLVDRNCDGVPDITFELTSDALKVKDDLLTGIPDGTVVGTGARGDVWEGDPITTTGYTAGACPETGTISGHLLIHLPNFAQYFSLDGLTPTMFGWTFDGGNNQDAPIPEDFVRGAIDLPEPKLDITKGPDLSLCEGQQGEVTITVTNSGNTKVQNIAVTDVLPNGWTFCGVTSGGVTGNQVGNTITFSSFDLDPCGQKQIKFCVTPTESCESGQDAASANGVFRAACLSPDPDGTIEEQGVSAGPATSNLVCNAPACVQVDCSPSDATVDVGEAYTKTFTATNCSPAAEDIVITVNGNDTSFPAVPTGQSVTVTINGTCDAAGDVTYTFSASATNSCGTVSTDPATCVQHCTPVETLCCWLTMGGFQNGGFRSGNKDNTFGGNVGPPPSGSWEHIQRNGKQEVFNFHSHDAHVIDCGNDGTAGPCHPAGDANFIDFGGTGAYSINGGQRTGQATFVARAEDHGEPGRQGDQKGGCGTPDYYTITVYDKDTGAVVFTVGALLDGGNIQIHDCKHSVETSNRGGNGNGRGGRLQTAGGGDATAGNATVTAPLELYRATPNPFANTTTIAYAVNQAEGADVSIGIYNVAGRRVRSLVSGYQSAGRYEVVWDGRGDDGAGVARGVYFLRAYVGGQSLAADSRILYLR